MSRMVINRRNLK